MAELISSHNNRNDTYDHRTLKTRLPVRSALFKQRTGGLVVRWVTTSEYPLLYVFGIFWHLKEGMTRRGVRVDGCVRAWYICFELSMKEIPTQ